ncbi:DUF3862 domain-containing protein [Clostridium botulinum]|uniref:DUF3862 domain-containing protein n=1 Tax=Clostridium botulinum TaxID=1491 RepID=A0A846J736_CLOBO|nr:DUF3862 domain-containing protein [Clostridium botulinum]ACA55278.1 putative lipoprotein [Clostridium botulinum A3 str. Loch Maree]NFH67328.1 DUF3862 domain-containing protein [Clostridium botulinum]NFJ07673.1 DUF3862 domain-containing protein [Clostridium botulinum]NFK13537.1 DUF3862 domain-containing protein [Clostridium botulinum]NFM95450.1 DUF3862 domain-containing protein [Clostridium botulinum]
MKKIVLPLCLTVLVLVGCGTKSAVNIKNYNKLQYGMDYNAVKKILGEGKEKGEKSHKNFKHSINTYEWSNEEGNMIKIVLEDNKVASIAQMGLK